MKIFLDDQGRNDVRENWAPSDWRRAINFAEFKSLIEEAFDTGEKIEAISFDNDLGEGSGEITEGLEIMKWMSREYPELFRPETEITIHSENIDAKRNMEGKLKFWQKHIDELIAAKERPDPWAELKMK